MLYLYESASTTSDYHDAALLCLLWYLFGRAPLQGVLCAFHPHENTRMQGLSLFLDADLVTCPLHAIAMAIIMQTAPTVVLIDNLPDVPVATIVKLSPSSSLLEVLNHPEEFAALEPAASPARPSQTPVDTTPTIYTHVNYWIASRASIGCSDVAGGAQDVSGCDGLTQRWIFDRGVSNTSTTNKGFNYIFNTSREDHKVSKTLNGYDTKTKVKALDLKPFDTEIQEKIVDVQRLLFKGQVQS
ncbi:LOW QUALITY PROTEIN: hypothetical protein PHPALM_30583 [Phytophthora palmivora]|uniref:Uncharacterized protein n=1 Tax=Phytophthora palmivora TaxID=4796 RepID=A0A2P4X4S9_9STRA|nr:LOW QUALITY PROTEIN: hypothetical protein PHPALM_30583 [Phytophthora palmivora]